ncbi:AAA family ATPase [Curtobacterium sp. PhB78]|uniref:AAA family ATPase n=1 Tax=Curtobacterium sp. PhB78 TaxID=2485102 RepID=UPI000F49297F|nr:AAA family ATPase [Curtobacterium sp. PhB78]ROS34525.1 AAA domain-containing protein [Curtobacterium sp. PhB78]
MTRPPTTFDARWLMEQNFPPTQYVVPGIIPEGMTLLVAAPKIGKSWLVLGLALDLHIGVKALGGIPTGAPRPVLYLALEDGPRRLQQRIRTLNPEMTTPRLEFETTLESGQVVPRIEEFMARNVNQNPVVILDTLGKVLPSTATTKSQYAADYDFLGALKATTDAEPGSSLIIVHHTRKSGGDDFLDAVSGTQGIAGAADTVLVLRRDRQEQNATLHVTSRDAKEGEYAMLLSDNGAWTLNGGGLEAARAAAEAIKVSDGVGDRMADIIAAVYQASESVSRQELQHLLPAIPVQQLDVYLKRAVDSNRLAKVARGLYGPVSSVRSVSSEEGSNTSNASNTPYESDVFEGVA